VPIQNKSFTFMDQTKTSQETAAAKSDKLTLISISALAYIIAVGLHEHLGHALMCVILGVHPTGLGAFYVNFNKAGVNEFYIRLISLAGPMVSLLTGVVCFVVLRMRRQEPSSGYYFTWLLGILGLMSAAGYLFFSGFSGIGDFGTTSDGVFYNVSPEWLIRSLLVVVGFSCYFLVILFAVRKIDNLISGSGHARIRYASRLAYASYFTGAAVDILIGLLNPHGLVIVLTSAAAGSLGGTSGLLWMMQTMNRKRVVTGPGLIINRSWLWITVSIIIVAAYAIIFGPTIKM